MRTLKALVIVMGVLIIGGVGVIAVTIANRTTETAAPTAPPGPRHTGFGTTSISIPPGSKVVETRLDGDRMILRLALANGETRILVLSLLTGREIGVIGLK